MSTRQEQIGFILKQAQATQHYGPLPFATIVAKGGGSECGESLKLYLRVDEANRIEAASFEIEGTTIGRAAAALTTEALIGKTLGEVLEMDQNEIVETLGREIVGDRIRSATVTLDTAKAAARKYLMQVGALTGAEAQV